MTAADAATTTASGRHPRAMMSAPDAAAPAGGAASPDDDRPSSLADVLSDPTTQWSDIREAMRAQGRGSFFVGGGGKGGQTTLRATTNASLMRALRESRAAGASKAATLTEATSACGVGAGGGARRKDGGGDDGASATTKPSGTGSGPAGPKKLGAAASRAAMALVAEACGPSVDWGEEGEEGEDEGGDAAAGEGKDGAPAPSSTGHDSYSSGEGSGGARVTFSPAGGNDGAGECFFLSPERVRPPSVCLRNVGAPAARRFVEVPRPPLAGRAGGEDRRGRGSIEGRSKGGG